MPRMFARDAVDFIVVPKALLADLRTCRRARLPNETGGFLVGHRREGSIEVVSFTPEQSGDHSTRTSFTRVGPGHARAIKDRWKATGGELSIVGDWHSHPWGTGSPSSTDKHAWKTLIHAVNLPIIALIIGELNAFEAYLVNGSPARTIERRLAVLQDDGNDFVFGPSGFRQ